FLIQTPKPDLASIWEGPKPLRLVLLAHNVGEAGRHHLGQGVMPDGLHDVVEAKAGDQVPAAGGTHSAYHDGADESEGFAGPRAAPRQDVRSWAGEQAIELVLPVGQSVCRLLCQSAMSASLSLTTTNPPRASTVKTSFGISRHAARTKF